MQYQNSIEKLTFGVSDTWAASLVYITLRLNSKIVGTNNKKDNFVLYAHTLLPPKKKGNKTKRTAKSTIDSEGYISQVKSTTKHTHDES